MKGRFTILTAALALLAFLAIPMGMRGQAPVGTTLWGETWTGGDANETPSAYGFEGTTVYGGATLTYAQSSTNTKLYEEALAGGESPELLLSKSNQTWTISNIPTGQATGMALTFKSNKTTFDVTSTTTGITISGSQKSWTIASTSSVTTFNLTIKNTGSSNARIDDIVLSVTTAGGDTPQPTTYTVTYDANGGSGTMTDSDSPYAAGATVTVLGNEFTRTDYEFDHWNTAADDSGTSYDEDDTFTINANTTLYAQWTENTTPTPGGITAILNIDAYAEANSWVNGTKYSTATVAPVTFTANGGGNTGKYYSNGQDWRFYQNESASITISVLEGFTLVSVTPTYSVSNGGVLKNGNATITSGTTVNVSGTSVTFTVGNSGSATNGQVRFTNIDVTYVSNGGTIPPSITANNVEIAYDAEEGIINYTINNPVEGGSIVASCDAEWIEVDDTPQTDAEGSIDFICAPNSNFYAHSAMVTLTYTYGDSKATVTKDVTVTQAKDPNANGSTAEYPIRVSEALEAIDEVETVSDIYVGGIVSAIVDEYSSTYHNITFDMIDEDGDEYYLRAYRCVGTDGVNASEVAVGDEVVVYGTLFKYNNSIYEFQQGCQLVSLIHPAVPSIAVSPESVELDAEEGEGAMDITYENLTITAASDFDIQYYNEQGVEISEPDWILAEVNEKVLSKDDATYEVTYTIEANNGPARTAYFKVYAMDDETNLVYSNLVTISQAAAPQQYTLTVEPFENLELITFVNDEMVMEGDGEIQVTEGNQIMLSIVALEGYEMETLMVNGVNHVNDIADDFTYTFEMPAENVTISATAVEDVPVTPGTWVLTNLADLTADDVFVIVGDNGDTYAMSNDKGTSAAPVAVAVTVVEGTLSAEPAANLQWNISITEDGYTFYPNGETETWLYCINTNNGVRVGTGDAKHFTLDEGYLTTTETTDQRYIGIYNSQDWRCYKLGTDGTFPANIANQTFSFYKKVVEPATETYTLTVNAYTNDNTKDGYNLIASPVNVNPATVAGMTEGDFDLYSFDESQADEWRNYEATAFNLVPGKGYLYAKKATTENQTYSFELTGIPYNNELIILSKSESGDFPGWNLVGNPFGETAVLSDNRDFYVMNSDGSDFIQGSGAIAPMQGIFVIAEHDREELGITVAGGTAIGPTEDSKLVLNLTKGRGIIDRAVVRFGEGRTLPKFMLNAYNTKLYITEGNQDFAVVRSNNEGEMPVSFKAAENGNYTLSVEAENVEASYLHLIDNMTGADVDLLATPSYSFEARTTDYANRFRLVFNTNGVEENNATANFAYFNGSSWTVNNMGEATLQVVDMMGRVISAESISGNTEVNLNQAAGVYMLRLVTGNDVKVQKVVVK